MAYGLWPEEDYIVPGLWLMPYAISHQLFRIGPSPPACVSPLDSRIDGVSGSCLL